MKISSVLLLFPKLPPGSRCLKAGSLPYLPEFREQVVLVFLDIIMNSLGTAWRKPRWPPASGRANRRAGRPRFDLHHDHPLALVHLANVPHQRHKRLRIGLQVVVAQGRKDFQALAVLNLGLGKTVLVGLHPRRREVGLPVLPTAEPQPDQAQIALVGVSRAASTRRKSNLPSCARSTPKPRESAPY